MTDYQKVLTILRKKMPFQAIHSKHVYNKHVVLDIWLIPEKYFVPLQELFMRHSPGVKPKHRLQAMANDR